MSAVAALKAARAAGVPLPGDMACKAGSQGDCHALTDPESRLIGKLSKQGSIGSA